ncbi:hypothetical protein ABH935_005739 [Catenulispora sp. GAS73]|uniref:hypothetical protein n=1 Tax=Catenulispora sp. GAS73 TaxID=3156269 RepID=UPI0035141A99
MSQLDEMLTPLADPETKAGILSRAGQRLEALEAALSRADPYALACVLLAIDARFCSTVPVCDSWLEAAQQAGLHVYPRTEAIDDWPEGVYTYIGHFDRMWLAIINSTLDQEFAARVATTTITDAIAKYSSHGQVSQ